MINEKARATWEELESIHPYYSDIDEWEKEHEDHEAFLSYQRRWLSSHSLMMGRSVRGPTLFVKGSSGISLKAQIKITSARIHRRLFGFRKAGKDEGDV